MVDLFGADKGNISLPPRLRSPELIDGEIDDVKQVMILNMQKAFYQVRITDIAQRIQRLQSRNNELEELCSAEKLLRSQTDVETADQITQLNRQIFAEMEKINDYQKRLQVVRKWMEEEKQAHLDKVEAADKKYAETRLAITSEIKVLNAKINVMEEYKLSKTDLQNKLIAGDNLIARRDDEAERRCEQIERKFKIAREKLKKEMYARLQGLAGTFQTEVGATMAKPIHRLMRENTFVKNELMDIVREFLPKKEIMKRTKKEDDQIIVETTTTKSETVQQLIASKIQGYLLTVVREQYERAKDCLENLKQSDIGSQMKTVEFKYESTKLQADKALWSISGLERGLHRQQTQLEFANYLRDRSNNELQRCTDIFNDVKYAVSSALDMSDIGKDLLEMENKQLMSHLLDIMSKVDTQRWKNRTPSLDTVVFTNEAYRIGDLGIDLSTIQSRHSRITTPEKKPSTKPSTMKILADLGIRLSVINSTDDREIRPWQTDINDQSEDLIDEKEDVITRESSLSLGMNGEEGLDQETLQPEILEEEVRGADREEKKAEGAEKIVNKETVAENETTKQKEIDDKVNVERKNENDESATIVIENNEQSVEENGK